MRLICPNCGAQYEVADDVIPEDGRDVQCSNCAHTWFESRGASNVEDEFSEEIAPPAATLADNDDDEVWGPEAYAPKPAPAPKPQPQRQELDPSIADILREEAAREAAARRAEADAEMENQPDLGLDSANAAPDQRSQEAQKRMSHLKGETRKPPVAEAAAAAASSRRELLPDIEDINSSLRSEAERGNGYAEPEIFVTEKKRGFRAGFLSVLVLLALLAALYIFAPHISAKFPAAEAPLNGYVATVDQGRLWLNGKLEDLLASLTADEAATSGPIPEAQPEAAPSVATEAPAQPAGDQ